MSISAVSQPISQSVSTRKLMVILFLGFASGLPASLTASTLQAWFTEAGSNLQIIGSITLLVLPYSFRFLWAPLFDYIHLPHFDRRRGWLLLLQLGLLFAITGMAFIEPAHMSHVFHWQFPSLLLLGFITAWLSASQDIVINAYQIEALPLSKRGLGASLYVTGWRFGVIISGGLALMLAKEIGWQQTYLLMAGLMLIGMFATLVAPAVSSYEKINYSFVFAVIAPFKDFLQRFKLMPALIFFLLILTYKIGDALALALNTTFLLRHVGFDLATVGLINKTVSLGAALLGGVTAGFCMMRLSLYRALIFFGLFQGIANLAYAGLAYFGKSTALLIFAAFTENFCSGMGTIALMALIMALCSDRFSATQFALLSAIAFFARTFAGPVAAFIVESIGWQQFFICCFLISLPTLGFVIANKKIIDGFVR